MSGRPQQAWAISTASIRLSAAKTTGTFPARTFTSTNAFMFHLQHRRGKCTANSARVSPKKKRIAKEKNREYLEKTRGLPRTPSHGHPAWGEHYGAQSIMRLRTSGVRPQDLRVHRLAAKSRPQENESRFVPVQNVPGAKGCWRSLARTRLFLFPVLLAGQFFAHGPPLVLRRMPALVG
jgi:hypothetical protein